MRRLTLIIALTLIAAACGGGGGAAEFSASDSTVSTLETPDTDLGGTSLNETTTTLAATDDDRAGPAPTAPPAIPDSDYPDIVVNDLSGGDVNLRELVLEDNPVLLWFWAPH